MKESGVSRGQEEARGGWVGAWLGGGIRPKWCWVSLGFGVGLRDGVMFWWANGVMLWPDRVK